MRIFLYLIIIIIIVMFVVIILVSFKLSIQRIDYHECVTIIISFIKIKTTNLGASKPNNFSNPHS